MSDGRPALFDSEKLHQVDFQHVRLVLPWNAASEHGTWETWLERARLQGFPVLVAPSIDRARDCDTGSCTGPSVAQYTAALRELLRRYPGIDAVEAWNEPNHAIQPTSRSAETAAAYYDAAKGLCAAGRCTAVAGNLLDGSAMAGYLDRYRAALRTSPDVWGVHNYFDATYFESSGVDRTLATGDTPVWLTETGGLVSFRSPTGTLPYDEHRAADSLRWLFGLVKRSPRIERVYLYGMWQQPSNGFDSALLRVDNTERESMSVVRDAIGLRVRKLTGSQAPELIDPETGTFGGATGGSVYGPATGGAGVSSATGSGSGGAHSAGAPGTGAPGGLRVVGKRVRVAADRRVTVRLRCIGTSRCDGRFTLSVGGWTSSRTVRVQAGAVHSIRLRAPAPVARSLKAGRISRRWVRVCDRGASCAAAPKLPVIAAAHR